LGEWSSAGCSPKGFFIAAHVMPRTAWKGALLHPATISGCEAYFSEFTSGESTSGKA